MIIMGILSLSLIAFFVIFLNRNLISGLLYPKLNHDKKVLIGTIFAITMAGFVFNSANQAINMANVAFKATGVLVRTSTIKAIINFVFDIIFGLKFGVIGISLSTVLVHLSGLVINYLVFRSKVLPKLSLVNS
jgi:Na+-driven multidrug efflux pump